MFLQLLEQFPDPCAGGNVCYLTGNPVGRIEESDGTVRAERVVDLGASIDGEGLLCIGEVAAQGIARLIGFVPSGDVEVMQAALDIAGARIAELEAHLSIAVETAAAVRQFDQVFGGVPAEDDEDAANELRCGDCGQQTASAAGLSAHRRAKHPEPASA